MPTTLPRRKPRETELAKGRGTPQQKAYGSLMMQCARYLQQCEAKITNIQKSVACLERHPAAKELQTEFDTLKKNIEQRRLNLLDQIAGFLGKAGNTDGAIAIYRGLLANAPLDNQAQRRGYTEKIAAAYERAEGWDKALQFYRDGYDHIPPEKQEQEINLRIKIGNLTSTPAITQRPRRCIKPSRRTYRPARASAALTKSLPPSNATSVRRGASRSSPHGSAAGLRTHRGRRRPSRAPYGTK